MRHCVSLGSSAARECDAGQSASLFLPSAGNRNGANLNNQGTNGNYWSSSLNTGNAQNAFNVNFNASNVWPANSNNRFNGFSVRPVAEFRTPLPGLFLSRP